MEIKIWHKTKPEELAKDMVVAYQSVLGNIDLGHDVNYKLGVINEVKGGRLKSFVLNNTVELLADEIWLVEDGFGKSVAIDLEYKEKGIDCFITETALGQVEIYRRATDWAVNVKSFSIVENQHFEKLQIAKDYVQTIHENRLNMFIAVGQENNNL